jgi:hypothetical protein
MIFKSFAKKFNLEFKIEVNNFPTQLISVIARKLSGSDGFPLFYFKKVFDTVWRTGLWMKLQNCEIKGKCFKIIYNMYNDIKSCVQS